MIHMYPKFVCACLHTPSSFLDVGPRVFFSNTGSLVGSCLLSFFFFFFCFLGPYLWHMDASRLGLQLELQLLAYTTATATPDPSQICDLCHSLWQRWLLNPPSKGWNLHLHGYSRALNPLSPQWEPPLPVGLEGYSSFCQLVCVLAGRKRGWHEEGILHLI